MTSEAFKAPLDRLDTTLAPIGYYKSLTVKLDRSRYEALKNAGVQLDKRSQSIFIEAFDLWFEQNFKNLKENAKS